jgi:hypothetical protein
MHDSDELRTLLADYWQALSTGNIAFVQEHLSTDPDILGCECANYLVLAHFA